MRRYVLVTLALWSLACLNSLFAQNTEFQTGKIVAVQKMDSAIPTGSTDAPTAQNRQRYKISIHLNDSTYVCRADTTEEMDLEWAQGKEVPARVNGKNMELRRTNGKVVRLKILATQKAE